MTDRIAGARLLPWTGQNGQPAYLRTDGGEESVLSAVADAMEVSQTETALDILKLAEKLLSAPIPPTDAEFTWVLRRLSASLVNMLRIAEARKR